VKNKKLQQGFQQLRLILGDQLNENHSWFTKPEASVCYVLMEIRPEATYVTHHIQKIVGCFLAMRAFHARLKEKGHHTIYLTLDDPNNLHSFEANCLNIMQEQHIETLAYLQPDEWRVDKLLQKMAEKIPGKVQVADTEHFLTARLELQKFFAGKKTYLMESFYRHIRRRYQILMEPDKVTPVTGQWNYDHENRKKLPEKTPIPPEYASQQEAGKIVEMLIKCRVATIGNLNPSTFDWPVTRQESLNLLHHFIQHRLANFGDFQDALTTRHHLLFHSRLSFSLNIKLINPLEVAEAAVGAWRENPNAVPFASLEGFVRQIIGWREYMRGVYWAKMPEYANLNFFEHRNPLPSWYWNGNTHMNCMSHTIRQSLEMAYAHHIQRLMVTGNFALLLGVDPDYLDEWYLGIYMDAFDWVEITNTRGMSQFADGGIVGTKPYTSTANYIHKMGDYCQKCPYDRTKRYGENACPFNSLYWHFYDRNRDKLEKNPRIGMVYNLWQKTDPDEKVKIIRQATYYQSIADKL
jgi:deoxyribodipyrimidine photolyase-related protein